MITCETTSVNPRLTCRYIDGRGSVPSVCFSFKCRASVYLSQLDKRSLKNTSCKQAT